MASAVYTQRYLDANSHFCNLSNFLVVAAVDIRYMYFYRSCYFRICTFAILLNKGKCSNFHWMCLQIFLSVSEMFIIIIVI